MAYASSRSKECIFHEIYSGPFKKFRCKVSTWAPKVDEESKIINFFTELKENLNNNGTKIMEREWLDISFKKAD